MRDVHITQFIDKEEIIITAKSALNIVLIRVDCKLTLPKYLKFLSPLINWLFITKVSVFKFNKNINNRSDPLFIKDYNLAPGSTINIDHKFEIIIKD